MIIIDIDAGRFEIPEEALLNESGVIVFTKQLVISVKVIKEFLSNANTALEKLAHLPRGARCADELALALRASFAQEAIFVATQIHT